MLGHSLVCSVRPKPIGLCAPRPPVNVWPSHSSYIVSVDHPACSDMIYTSNTAARCWQETAKGACVWSHHSQQLCTGWGHGCTEQVLCNAGNILTIRLAYCRAIFARPLKNHGHQVAKSWHGNNTRPGIVLLTLNKLQYSVLVWITTVLTEHQPLLSVERCSSPGINVWKIATVTSNWMLAVWYMQHAANDSMKSA